ncbi:hypothetical protein HYH02_005762 [Chlamydomonas schloesseri]|uniref:Uncharacterized protein n=1 Tax=Chlamydomonas schloesseri TaxID=2026947 RepID=A0A835WJU5_9CHLO|nr:hypothetical protein HYH02_005762 [Chlamydomonas schloesseri]|eukprot:KAG2449008.1 hypothetical protein HYH02_005762 [Chlamydomonas schloesseri]
MTDADDFLCDWACQVLEGDQMQGLEDCWSPSHSSFDCAARDDSECSPTATCSPAPPSPAITNDASSLSIKVEQQASQAAALTLIQALAAQQQQSLRQQQAAACVPTAAETSTSTAQSTGSLSQALAAIASQQPSRPGKRGRKPFPKLADLQQKLDELSQQHRTLASENVFLKNKLKVLERVVPLRDEAVNSLSAAINPASFPAAETASIPLDRPAYPPLSPTPSGESGGSWPGAAPAADEARQDEAVTSSGGPSVSATCSYDESARSGNRMVAPCSGVSTDVLLGVAAFSSVSTCGTSLCSARAHARRSSPRVSCGAAPSGVQHQHQQAVSLVALCPGLDGEAAPLTAAAAEELRYSTSEQVRGLWRHVCMQLGVLVTGAEVHGPGSAPAARLERYVQRLGCFLDKLALLAPSSILDSMYTSVESGLPERPSDAFWFTCARSLQLSQQQVSELAALSAYHRENVASLVQQRMQAAAQLTLHATQQPGAAACGGQDDLVQQLAITVEKEHAACRDLSDYVRTSVLTPLQVAKLTTAAFPLIPDWVALLHSVEQHATSFAVPTAMATGQAAASAASIAALASLLSVARQGAAAVAAAAATPAAAAPRPPASSVPPAVQLQAFLAALQAQQALARAAA